MHRISRRLFWLALLCFHSSLAVGAQGTAANSATAKIPVRNLSAPDAVGSDTLGMVVGFRQFADGRVIVNDAIRRRVAIYDQSLRLQTIVADSSGKPGPYPGPTQSPMFDYLGDSVLIVDFNSQTLLLIGPSGKIARALAPPRARDLTNMLNPPSGVAFDATWGVIHRSTGTSLAPPRPGAPPAPRRSQDTLAIIRADFETRSVDTLARITVPFAARPFVTQDDKGVRSAQMTINPFPIMADAFVVTSDGSVAIVRSLDYHIDWVSLDGKTTSTPKMPMDWRRITDDDKQARIDSVRRRIDSLTKTGGRPPNMIVSSSLQTRKIDTIFAIVDFVALSEMPDYVPPYLAPSLVKADRDNNVWIAPSTTFVQTNGGVMYDVVNRKGEIVERVIVPAGRIIAGFAPGGVVCLLAGSYSKGFVLERTRIVRSGT